LTTDAITHAFQDGLCGHIGVAITSRNDFDLAVPHRQWSPFSAADGAGVGVGITNRMMAPVAGQFIA
jgi:hypothetical protein